jgi:hypothetical protein
MTVVHTWCAIRDFKYAVGNSPVGFGHLVTQNTWTKASICTVSRKSRYIRLIHVSSSTQLSAAGWDREICSTGYLAVMGASPSELVNLSATVRNRKYNSDCRTGLNLRNTCCCNAFKARSQNCRKRLLASPCLSIRSSALMEQLGSHWTNFHEIRYLWIFLKSAHKIQVWLKSDDTWRCVRIFDNISLNSS